MRRPSGAVAAAVLALYMAYNLELRQRWMVTPNAPVFAPWPFLLLGIVVGLAVVVLLGAVPLERREDYLQA